MKEKQSRKGLIIALLVILVMAGIVGFVTLRKPPASELARTRVLLAGDSRSSTDYTFYKDTLEKKTGCIALVKGASGKTAAYDASDEYIAEITGSDHDFSLWLVGGNDDDSAGSIGTFAADSSLGRVGNRWLLRRILQRTTAERLLSRQLITSCENTGRCMSSERTERAGSCDDLLHRPAAAEGQQRQSVEQERKLGKEAGGDPGMLRKERGAVPGFI